MHGISEGRAVAVEDHQPEAPAPGPGATARNAPATGPGAPAPEAAGPGAPDTDAVGAAGSAPWGADSIVAPGTEPIPDPAVDSPPDAAAGARGPRSTTTPHKKTARRGRKPAIIRAKDPLTRKTLAVPRQVVGRISGSGKLGTVGSASPRWTCDGRFQASASWGRMVLNSAR